MFRFIVYWTTPAVFISYGIARLVRCDAIGTVAIGVGVGLLFAGLSWVVQQDLKTLKPPDKELEEVLSKEAKK